MGGAVSGQFLAGDLEPTFGANATSFVDALKPAGASAGIAATYRPRERAYLMHYSSMIARGEIQAANVPAMDGVNIEWVRDTDEDSKQAARAMATGYGMHKLVSDPPHWSDNGH